ncbi:MAG: DUF3791 domain-containing protein [Prevotellaceae bacterium]|jgi:hypothetical protein|nr:DUF3791 domain-containing protein [Prevotellaceae bacterium]
MYNETDSKKKFVVFAIEEYRNRKGIDGKTAITLFEKSGLLQYIEDFYDVLHSNGTEYLIADFDDYFKHRNIDDYDLNENEKKIFIEIQNHTLKK